MKKTSFSKNQQGLNLIELLLVLAIVVAIAVAAFVIYPRVQAGRAASSNSQIISAALAQVQSIYQSGQYSTLSNDVAYAADVFPDSFKGAAGVLNNEFATDALGNVFIAGVDAGITAPLTTGAATTNTRLVGITYGDVPSRVCMKLVPGLAANFGKILVGTTVVMDKLNASAADDVINEGAMVTACGGGATPVSNVDITMVAR